MSTKCLLQDDQETIEQGDQNGDRWGDCKNFQKDQLIGE